MRKLVLLGGVLALAAGCGNGAPKSTPKPPRIPRALAQSWARQADAVSAALAAGDGCTARSRATALQQDVNEAAKAHRVPQPLLARLSGGVTDLVARITCTPPPPAPQPVAKPPHEKPPKPPKPPKHEHEHDRHGHGDG